MRGPNLELLAQRCQAEGLALTPQREAIYRALAGSFDHPSPESLYERVRGELPSISLATIYKTLDTLVRLGVAAELPSVGDTKRYDGNMGPHHHLVCQACNRIEDFDDPTLDDLSPRKAPKGFRAQRVSVSIHGICRSCSTKAPANSQSQ